MTYFEIKVKFDLDDPSDQSSFDAFVERLSVEASKVNRHIQLVVPFTGRAAAFVVEAIDGSDGSLIAALNDVELVLQAAAGSDATSPTEEIDSVRRVRGDDLAFA